MQSTRIPSKCNTMSRLERGTSRTSLQEPFSAYAAHLHLCAPHLHSSSPYGLESNVSFSQIPPQKLQNPNALTDHHTCYTSRAVAQ
jgi:hypothetical protein